MILVLVGLSAALSVVAAVAATVAALWARSGARALDGFATITLPLLARVKQKVDPDPMVASVVAAAAAAPPPAIIEPIGEPSVSAAPLPVIVAEDDDELRESAPLVEPDEHSPTIPMQAPRAHTAPGRAPTMTDARGDRARAEVEQDASDARWAGGAPPLVAEPGAGAGATEPPETGPSRSGERERESGHVRPAGCFAAYVVPDEPPASDLPSSSMIAYGAGAADATFERRRRAHELGQATERQRQAEARKQREAEELARRVRPLSDEEAARPSGEGFAMDRPSWDGQTAIHDKVSLQAAMPPPPVPVPIARIVPRGAATGRGDTASSGVHVPPPPVAPPRASPPPPAAKPRAKADSSPTLTSQGVVRGPQPRFDPRVEPESRVDVLGPPRRR